MNAQSQTLVTHSHAAWFQDTRGHWHTPQLDRVVADVTSDLSFGTAPKYRERLTAFADWLQASNYGAIDKQAVADYKKHLAIEGRSASTINGHLVAVRALLRGAADMGLMDDRSAERAAAVKGVKEKGERAGNWLGKSEAQALVDAPDQSTLKGIRDRAILCVLVSCGLRRAELAALTVGHLQTRDGHRVIADMIGKGGRVRTVVIPVGVGRVIDQWLEASARTLTPNSLVFVAMRKGGKVADGETITAQALYKLVREYCEAIGKRGIAPHDLRRTFAKLAYLGGASIESISQALGHESIETTQRYLGLDLDLDNAAPDRVGLRIA